MDKYEKLLQGNVVGKQNTTQHTVVTERIIWYWFAICVVVMAYYYKTQPLWMDPLLLLTLITNFVTLYIHFRARVENERFDYGLELIGNLLIYRVYRHTHMSFILNQMFGRSYNKKHESKMIEESVYEVQYMSAPKMEEETLLFLPFRIKTKEEFNDLAALSFNYVKGQKDKFVSFEHYPTKSIRKMQDRIILILQIFKNIP